MPQDKIGLLFMITQGLAHPRLWERFLAGNQGRYEVFTLCKFPERLTVGFLKPTVVDEYVSTSHGSQYPHNGLAMGQVALLRAGLECLGCKKFMFVSETCVPIRTLDYVYTELTKDDRSWISHGEWEARYRMLPEWTPISREQFGTSSNWIALNRRHARILVEMEPVWMEHFVNVVAADEHYPSTMLAINGVDFTTECYPHGTTHVDWERVDPDRGGPHIYDKLSDFDIDQLIRCPYLLARKFRPLSNVAEHIDHIVGEGEAYTRRAGLHSQAGPRLNGGGPPIGACRATSTSQ